MAPAANWIFFRNLQKIISKAPAKLFFQESLYRKLTNGSSFNLGDKVVKNVGEALEGLADGDTVLVGGFGNCGQPELLLNGVLKRGVKDLTVVSCTGGADDWGVAAIIKNQQVRRLITTYIGENENLRKQFLSGTIEVELTPQGTLVEKIRAGGAGIPAFYSLCGVGTLWQEGGIPVAYKRSEENGNGHPEVRIFSECKPTAVFDDKTYVLETAIKGDFALAHAWKADTYGNLIFRKTAQNFNPMMLTAAKVGVVEVEEIVPAGTLDPHAIHLPGIYVDRIFLGDKFEKRIEKRTVRKESNFNPRKTPAQEARIRIARRVALEFRDGMYANLGIGIPTMAVDYIPAGIKVILQGENGVLGLGGHPTEEEIDPDMTNPSKELATVATGAVFLETGETFSMIRGGHLDITVLGAIQVSQYGDLANWVVPGKLLKGMGGAMDLVAAPGTKVVVAMEHMAKDGSHKIVSSCDIPVTGRNAVDMIITEKCVFEVDPEEGLTLTELAEGVEVPEIIVSTGCEFNVAEKLKPMGQAPADEF